MGRASALLQRKIGRNFQALDEANRSATDAMWRTLRARAGQLSSLEARLRHMDLRLRFADARRRLDAAEAALTGLTRQALVRTFARHNALSGQLQQLSPLAVLDRGYAIVQNASQKVVVSPEQVSEGEMLRIRLARGELRATSLTGTNVKVDTIKQS